MSNRLIVASNITELQAAIASGQAAGFLVVGPPMSVPVGANANTRVAAVVASDDGATRKLAIADSLPELVAMIEADTGFTIQGMPVVVPVDDSPTHQLVAVTSTSPGGGGGEAPEAATWATLPGKPAVIAAGADQAAARGAIGAGTGNGTSNLVVATTAPAALAAAAAVGTGTTAARADHVHPLPTAAGVGAAAATHTHVGTAVTLTGYAIGAAAGAAVAPADTVNAAIGKLEKRIADLEAAATP